MYGESNKVNMFIDKMNRVYNKITPNDGGYLQTDLLGMTTKEVISFVYGKIPSSIVAIKRMPTGRLLVHAVSENALHNICRPIRNATPQALEYHVGALINAGKISRLPAVIHKPNGKRQNAFVYVQYGCEDCIEFVEEPDEKAKRTTRTRRAAKTRQILGRSSTKPKHSTVISAILDILPSTVPESMIITEDVPGTTRFCIETLGMPRIHKTCKTGKGTYYTPVEPLISIYKHRGDIHGVKRIMKTEHGARIVNVYYTGYAVQKEYSDESLNNMLCLMRKEQEYTSVKCIAETF